MLFGTNSQAYTVSFFKDFLFLETYNINSLAMIMVALFSRFHEKEAFVQGDMNYKYNDDEQMFLFNFEV